MKERGQELAPSLMTAGAQLQGAGGKRRGPIWPPFCINSMVPCKPGRRNERTLPKGCTGHSWVAGNKSHQGCGTSDSQHEARAGGSTAPPPNTTGSATRGIRASLQGEPGWGHKIAAHILQQPRKCWDQSRNRGLLSSSKNQAPLGMEILTGETKI